MLTPTGTPKLVSQRLHRDLMGILLLADVKDRLAKIDFEIVGSTSEEFSALIKSEVTRWSNVVKASGANFN
jgi:tripartite-type tricarboxylate transporter receptor subunit TctC